MTGRDGTSLLLREQRTCERLVVSLLYASPSRVKPGVDHKALSCSLRLSISFEVDVLIYGPPHERHPTLLSHAYTLLLTCLYHFHYSEQWVRYSWLLHTAAMNIDFRAASRAAHASLVDKVA